MPEPTCRLTLVQFRALLPDTDALTRTLDAIHVHHTWKPERADFRGHETIEAMRRFHMDQRWSDIAQHLTIDPQGGLWTGRNWNLPPVSAKGHNGTSDVGPFMIEMIGNFDVGHDPFDGPQRDAAIRVVEHVLRIYGLPAGAIKFHRELSNNQKTCPGTGIDRAAFEAAVATEAAAVAAEAAKKPRAAAPLFSREFLVGFPVTQPFAAQDVEDATVPENIVAAETIECAARAGVAAAQERFSRDFARLLDPASARGEDWSALKPHVVNLSRGELSEGGQFATTPADLDGIIDAIRDRAASDRNLRILLYAHGGLVGESDALGYARQMHRWWLSKGVYPVFFVWESGLLETLRQYVVGPRDVFDWTSDLAIELALKGPGSLVWAGMKASARRASASDLGEGYPGGAYLFGGKLATFLGSPAAANVTLHAIGHSAGAIFHAHLLPMLLRQKVPRIESFSLFAPASRVELFKKELLPLIQDKSIARHSCFTMEEEAEGQDNCWNVYRKSLLYLVSHSFEGVARRSISGLHRSIRKDADLRTLYGVDSDGLPVPGASPLAELRLSYARDKEENPLTRSLTHGGFDNDPKTVSAALRRILGIPDETGFGESDFPYPALPRVFDFPEPLAAPLPPVSSPVPPGAHRAGRKVALCIGIDSYRDRPLAGCVNDARAWGRTLTGLGFDVRYLLDAQATNQAMQDALRDMLTRAHAGDVLVMQYAGHGTQLPDDNGDEDDGFDEAFVPVDYHTGALFLRDDVIGAALAGLPKSVALTLFMDCCHCGTISRFAPAMRASESASDRVRYLPMTPALLSASRSFRSVRRATRPLRSSAPGVIHLAACRDNEFAWESSGQGDFTAAATFDPR